MYPTDTKDKTGNHQSHFNAHRSPSSQDERLPKKPVLPCQHVQSKRKNVLSLLERFNAVTVLEHRGLGLFIYNQYHLYKGISEIN